ncbi:MAG: AIR carboxylase family protein [Candidatus Heimdallarchaeota archaeon]
MFTITIIAGSKSDERIVNEVTEVLENNVDFTIHYASCHRNPEVVDRIVAESSAQVFICIAGLAAALPGYVAARTKKPVIGVPVSGLLNGLDALLSIAQLPKGVPVACVGIDNGQNAGLLALRILRK